jgi:uncharacterized membrane protein
LKLENGDVLSRMKKKPPILFYVGIVIAAASMIFFVLNVSLYDNPITQLTNISLLMNSFVGLMISVTQFLEWKRKANESH